MSMPGMSWRGITTWALLAAAAVSGWVLWQQRDQPDALAAPMGRADYVLEDFELVSLDEQGLEAFTLRAPRLARDPNGKTMDITRPLFLIPPQAGSQGKPWEVRSKTGWVSAKGEELRLRGAVTAVSTTADGKPIRMSSEQLNVFPKGKRATSAVEVSVSQPGLILNGRGLEADLNAKSAILKSDVKGRYESSPR